MTHLTHAELVEATESAAQLREAAARHLRDCAACQKDVEALRGVLARAVEDRIPEPSPLFWEHFAARVSHAVRSESIDAGFPWLHRVRRPLATWAVVAAAIVLVITTFAWRATLHAPAPVSPPPMPASSAASSRTGEPAPQALVADNVDADDRWAVVRVAAEDLEWEDVHAAGIAAAAGAAEGLALELTDDERTELARLLDREMKRNGA